MWTPPILLVLAIAQVVLGDAIFELQLIKFHNPAGRENNGNCCESWFSSTCSAGDPSKCDPELKICVDYPYSTKCTTNKSRSTGIYWNNHSITFGSSFKSGVSNPMIFRIIPWKSAVKITIQVDDIDGGAGGSNDFMGEKSVIFEENLVDQQSGGTWYNITFTYSHQIITAKARAYCSPNYYGANCTGYCKAKDDVINGHYTCAEDGSKVCLEYYYGDSCKVRCQPIDGYVGHVSCDENGTAICGKGWVGVNCSEDINECLNTTDNPCYPRGTCSNYNGSYSCACDDAYTGPDCQDLRSYCDENPCSNTTAQCYNTLGGFLCICEEGWSGHTCDVEITPCTNNHCRHNSTCAVMNDTYECNCTNHWQGNNCETEKKAPCESSPCLNNGICTVTGAAYRCVCVSEWEGTECQTRSVKMEDEGTIYLKGYLQKEYVDDLRDGIRRLLESLNITDADIIIMITYQDQKKTRVDIFVESSNPDISGSLHKLFYPTTADQRENVNKNLPLPLTDKETTPVPVKPDPLVKENWYVIVIVVVVALITLFAVIAACHILGKRRIALIKKSGFDHDRSAKNVTESVPEAGIHFDNNIYSDAPLYVEFF